jgi:anthranilate phosphoribosyltransferase
VKPSVLPRLLRGDGLTFSEARVFFRGMLGGGLTDAEVKAVLLCLARRGESAEELRAFVASVREMEPPIRTVFPRLMDVCGTGGDGAGSFNISTLAAIVVAGAGGQIAKHGNRSISSRCGSSDLMSALGVRLEAPQKKMIGAIRRSGIGYFHAPFYHPVFSRFQPLRCQLRVRTIFNLAGPLLNPLALRYQLIGVASREAMTVYARVLARQGLRRAWVCHSRDGMDEISTRALTDAVRIENGKMIPETLDPRKFGFGEIKGSCSFRGGTVAENRKTALGILSGRNRTGARDIVVLNAAAALWVCRLAQDVAGGVALASEAIDSGKAFRALGALVRESGGRL